MDLQNGFQKIDLSPWGKTIKVVITTKVCSHKLKSKKTNNFRLMDFFLLSIRIKNYPEYTRDSSYLTATLFRL